ncbi:thiamine pyrophosphate-binding protein [Myxococcus sp. CA033]|uniref:alpha-keto acid decarboxylase family protein n=1 Tax=Myxococcus sp. CA033 TaxID=2741516 RepID=UPI001C2D0D30
MSHPNMKSREVSVSVGDYLLARLQELGIHHVFGVPGDFNLGVLEQLLKHPGLRWVGCCNELNAAYAADGYARMRGVAALLTAYGVGELSTINGIAGAYAERVPVVAITGAPPLSHLQKRSVIHHSLGDGDFGNTLASVAPFTVAQAVLTQANAPQEIDRVLRTCLRERRPVYLQLPSDVTFQHVPAPEAPLVQEAPRSDPDSLRLLLEELVPRLRGARRCALLVDSDIQRFGLASKVLAMAEAGRLPIALLSSARGLVDEGHPAFLGFYGGRLSDAYVRDWVDGADCVVALGTRFTDLNTHSFSHRLESARLVDLQLFSAALGQGTQGVPPSLYSGLVLSEVLEELTESLGARGAQDFVPRSARLRATAAARAPVPIPKTGTPLTHAQLWPALAGLLEPEDVLVVEAGSPMVGFSSTQLPRGVSWVAQPLWCSIGYTLPALLGTSLAAAPERRHLLFIGDGSFIMTAQELSTLLHLKLKPLVFLINNAGYTIERLIVGPESVYNDIPKWNYPAVCDALGAPGQSLTLLIEKPEQVAPVLAEAVRAQRGGRLVFVEVRLAPLDAPAGLAQMGASLYSLSYRDDSGLPRF